MYFIVQFPLVDLRPLVPGQKGRLLRPDWTNPNLASGFIRGFGKLSERNKSGLGLEGEGVSADFNNALKFPKMIDISEDHWSARLHANVWFRRLYFDGKFCGRFEVAFTAHDGEASQIHDKNMEGYQGVDFNIARSIKIIENTPVEVISPDSSIWKGKLIDAAKPLGLAYISATTEQSKLTEFLASETYGTDVAVSSPRVWVTINNNWKIADTKDKFVLSEDDKTDLYITSSESGKHRRSVTVQKSNSYNSDESAEQRTVRILFAHLNSLIFAQNYFIENNKSISDDNKREKFSEIVSDMISRFSSFSPEQEKEETQKKFLAGLKGFGLAYERRIPDLLKELESIAEELEKPSTLEKGLKALRTLYEIVVRATVDKAIDTSMGR